jgi:alpha-mannosidase
LDNNLHVFIVPHWHFDALWQLPFEEYFNIISRNISDLLEFIDKEPEYKFCLDQTIYIEEFMKRNPELNEKLINAVNTGSIEPVCGGYTQPDSNLPSGEFLVRNTILYIFFIKKYFNAKVSCGWYLDTYGHSAQLPQIFKDSGINYYTFMRGCPVQGIKEPKTEFFWEGIDGTRILTHWMPFGYGAGYIPQGDRNYVYHLQTINEKDALRFLKNLVSNLKNKSAGGNLFVPNGSDFSPPQRLLPKLVRTWREESEHLDVSISTANSFFEAVEKSVEKLPIVKYEFNPMFQGTYSARIRIKQENRRAENLYITSEKFATIASSLGSPYPEKDLEKSLKLILLNQFHDAINGEVIDEVYKKMLIDYYRIEKNCRDILEDSLKFIIEKIDTKGYGIPIVVFNQLSWLRTDVAEAKIVFGEEVRDILLKDDKGQEIPFQVSGINKNPDSTLNNVKIVFIAEDVPALGYKTYFVVPLKGSKSKNFKTGVSSSSREGVYQIENQYYSIMFDSVSKLIKSIYDKEACREALHTEKYLGNILFDEPEYGTTCHSNGDIQFGHETSIPIKELPNPEVSRNNMDYFSRGSINESGPIRAKVDILGRLQSSTFKQTITIYNKIKRVECKTEIVFEGERRKIRVGFPINVTNGDIWHEIPYGAIKRCEGEYPAINWVDLSNKDFGVSLINQGLPGNSIIRNFMIITLLRSIDAMYLGNPSNYFSLIPQERFREMYLEEARRISPYYPIGSMALEKGAHTFSYALYPHKGTWREAKSYKTALEFNNPFVVVKGKIHKGILPKMQSFLSVEPENLIVTALKKSGRDILIRFYEAEGKSTSGSIKFFKPIASAWETNLIEEKKVEMKIKNDLIFTNVKGFKISSILLQTK